LEGARTGAERRHGERSVGDMVVGAAAGDLKSEGVRGVVGARGAGATPEIVRI
jgi:hypothetical protein